MSIKSLFDICRSIHAWMALDYQNVAVIHCTNGIGRTGVVIACYLRYIKLFDNSVKAFEYYMKRRTPEDYSWATINYKRYVQYFNNIMQLAGNPPNPYPLKLHSIVLNGIPDFDGKEAVTLGLRYTKRALLFSQIKLSRPNMPRRRPMPPYTNQLRMTQWYIR